MAVTLNASTSTGLVQTADTSGIIQLQSNGTTVATVNTSNNVQFKSSISVGDATPTTSGAGITFPATQSASSDANTLDDYEEGTWTPLATAGSGSITSYTSSGTYTKVGRFVYLAGQIQLVNVGTASNTLTLSGLPFTTLGGTTERPCVAVSREDNSTGVIYTVFLNINATTGIMSSLTNGAIVWTNSYRYTFSLYYQVA